MSEWIELAQPRRAKAYGDNVSVLPRDTRFGLRLRIYFSRGVMAKIGSGPCVVSRHATLPLIRILRGEDGPIMLSEPHPKTGAAFISVEAPPGTPRSAPLARARVVTCEDGELVFELPVAEWRALPPAVEPEAPPPSRALIDPVEFLSAEGHEVKLVAPGVWLLDGDSVGKTALLAAMNRRRTKKGLPSIKLLDLAA